MNNLENSSRIKFLPLHTWNKAEGKPFLVAGPCSAESREQILTIAEQLQSLPVQYYRAGIWKPRTRPGAFEGVGIQGLPWLQEAQERFGIPWMVEVANADHVHQCLKHNIRALWIGARSTVNPFTVQEIADSVAGMDIPIFIKNPINPDVALWIGAIERIYAAGIRKIVAVHRGFSSFEQQAYRNKPMWELPIELKRRFPDLPILCDPSHIGGKREWIGEISQKAMDLDFDGLMIETHPNPEQAWSDAAQQITPNHLKTLLQNLIIRTTGTDDAQFNHSLEQLREIINQIDFDFVQLLSQRMELVEQIGGLKKEKQITILQPERWREIFNSRTEWGAAKGLSPDMVFQIFQIIHKASIQKQTEVLEGKIDMAAIDAKTKK